MQPPLHGISGCPKVGSELPAPTVALSDVPAFAGRCEKRDQFEKISNRNAHECTVGATANPGFIKYSEYLENRKSCMEIRNCPCQCKATIDNATVEATAATKCKGYTPSPPPGTPAPTKPPLETGYSTTGTAGKYILVWN